MPVSTPSILGLIIDALVSVFTAGDDGYEE
jgi:hypothetical protein